MYSINQNYIQWFAQAFISVTPTYIQWTREIYCAIKNRFFLFLLCHSGVFLFSTRLYIQEGDLFFVLKKFPCLFIMTESVIKCYDDFQFLFLR